MVRRGQLRRRRIVRCVYCNRFGEHKGRGLCASCWNYHAKHGLLEEFPRVRLPSAYVMLGQSEHIMERVEMFAEMEAQGVPREVIAERLCVTERTLTRYAAHIRNMERGGDRDG